MSWRDRPYSDDDFGYGSGRPELRFRLPRPTTLVAWLVIINVAVHIVHLISLNLLPPGTFSRTFGLSLRGLATLKIWQPVTYMFVHAADELFHLIFNMLLLYFVGREIERGFGRQRFIRFYAVCGIVGGLAYLILGAISPDPYYYVPLVGASGAVWGLLIAAMIFYPHMQIIFIIFPMPIRVFGAIILALVLLQAITPGGVANLGGEVCHFGGALAGVGILYYWGMMPAIRFGSGGGPNFMGRLRKGAWERKQRKLAEEQAEVDRILEKVHAQGINSLSRRERKKLAVATQRQRERDRQAGRVDRV
ncbi:MAG TPA: rhomboid family intramembrane serine protease [Phycisphaerae bacterium]|nr:rhomboid family intramembrane serine protease [Phycisphaerae bacterium]HOJ74860.1 rhomboid family intramembrane serine protease [Phycisphaerae bacterium]HOM52023.1 rhomboid family intramembrane serine protease [Phycisphaerae bacterium]HON66587.1 rhomboid family intramembrane serine protease [Phycisphaerae bacterium]HOQ86216.1 rhomboid family intramembrane serine protease [Phycisphaerae bacterium]